MQLIRHELIKIWKRKQFIAILISLLAVNLMLLWYTQNTRGLPNSQAYMSLRKSISALPGNQEKLKYLKNAWERAQGNLLVSRAEEMRAEGASEEKIKIMISSRSEDAWKLYERFAGKSDHDARPYFCDDFGQEADFLGRILDECTLVSGYQSRLEEILGKSGALSSISIFTGSGENDYFSKNTKKTEEAYGSFIGKQVDFIVQDGYLLASGSISTDIVLLMAAFFLAVILVFEEKRKGLFRLTKVTVCGRNKLMACKLTAISVSMLVIVLLVYASNFIYAGLRFGFDDWSSPIQACAAFLDSVLPLSLGGYTLLFILLKWLTALSFAMILVLITILARNIISSLIAGAAIFGSGLLVYSLVPPLSDFAALRFINPVGIMQLNGILGIYRNFNWRGMPVNLFSLAATYLILSSALFAALSILVFSRLRTMTTSEFFLIKLFKRTKLFRYRPTSSLYMHELYKVLMRQKFAAVITCTVIAASFLFSSGETLLSAKEIQYRNYMRKLQGPVTEKTLQFINEEEELIKDAGEKVEFYDAQAAAGKISREAASELSLPYMSILTRQEAFEAVKELVGKLHKQPGTEVVYDTGIRSILARSGKLPIVFVYMLLGILAFSAVYAGEYEIGTDRLIRCTPGGRTETVKKKWLTVVSVTSVYYAVIAAFPVLRTLKTYGLFRADPGVGSIPGLTILPGTIPIWLYLVIHFMGQLVSLIAVTTIITWISYRTKKTGAALFFASVLFIVPLALAALGIDLMKKVSILPLFQAAQYLMPGKAAWQYFVLIAASVICAVLAYFQMRFGFGRAGGGNFKGKNSLKTADGMIN